MGIKAVVYVERRSVSPESRPNVTPHDAILQAFDDVYLANVCTSFRIPRHALAMTSIRHDDITVICHDEVEAKEIRQALNRLLPPASSEWMSAYDIIGNAYVGFERWTEESDLKYKIHVDPAAVSGVHMLDQEYMAQVCSILGIPRQPLDIAGMGWKLTCHFGVECPDEKKAKDVCDALNAMLPPPSDKWMKQGNVTTAVIKIHDMSV